MPLEGSTLTLWDTQLVYEGREPNSGKSLREINEARNHDRALRRIEDWVKTRSPKWVPSEADLLAVHADVLADVSPEDAGRTRASRVLITGTRFVPPGPHHFAELIPALLMLAADETLPPILRAAELHHNLVAVHPFADGNGRTARLAMNSGSVSPVEVSGRHFQARCGRRAANEAQHDQHCAQHATGPRGHDPAEESVLDRVPLRTPRRVMANRDLLFGSHL